MYYNIVIYIGRKDNEEQAIFNSRLDETVAEAETELAAASSSTTSSSTTVIARARECLQKGRQLLAKRQKLIRIADRSEHGWEVVVEYSNTADELADYSGDEIMRSSWRRPCGRRSTRP